MNKVHVKICGLTDREDARVAVEAGADLLGFIFYAKSPRYVAPAVVAEIIRELKAERRATRPADLPKFVGVFVSESVEYVTEILAQTDLDYAQLHGNETPEMVNHFQGCAFKVLRPASAEAAFSTATEFAALGIKPGPGFLMDAYDPNLYGGTGKTTDWHVAAELAAKHPGLLLAGSLTPDNVAEAIRAVQPWGVDVSSGVEATPGRKDHQKVQEFIKNAKSQIIAHPDNK